MTGTMTITCTEEKTECQIATETTIDGALHMSDITDRFRLLNDIAEALDFSPEDWLRFNVFRLLIKAGAVPDGKHLGNSTIIDIGAIERAMDALGDRHDEV